MPNRVRVVAVRDNERAELQRRARSKAEPVRVAQRARIVLLAEQGLTGPQIAERVGCSDPTVVLWRDRYAQSGLVGVSGRKLSPAATSAESMVTVGVVVCGVASARGAEYGERNILGEADGRWR